MKRKILVLAVAMIFLMSCASMMVVPKTGEQRIAYVKATLTGLNNSAASLVKAGTLSTEDAKQYEKEALKVKMLVSYAEISLKKGDDTVIFQRWNDINNLLVELNKYLLERSKR